MTTIIPEVRAGAALLDETRDGWREQINLDTLDVGDWNACVLGQLYGDYSSGLNALLAPGTPQAERSAFARAHGFTGSAEDGSDGERALTPQWLSVITEVG